MPTDDADRFVVGNRDVRRRLVELDHIEQSGSSLGLERFVHVNDDIIIIAGGAGGGNQLIVRTRECPPKKQHDDR